MAEGGSWDVLEGMKSLWDSSGLATEFTNRWSASDASDFVPLNDTEARPNTPFPYCVFLHDEPFEISRHSHKTDPAKVMVQEQLTVDFMIYSESEQEAATMARLFAASFRTGASVPIETTCSVQMTRRGSYRQRMKEAWVWVTPIDFLYEYEEAA